MSGSATIACPTCGGAVTVPPAVATFPFCSPRCRMLDLGHWLDGSYALDPSTGKLDVIDPDEAVEVVLPDDDEGKPTLH